MTQILEYHNEYEGGFIIYDMTNKKEIGRIVYYSKTETKHPFLGFILKDDIKLIEDKDESEKARHGRRNEHRR